MTMSTPLPGIDANLSAWLGEQQMFFITSAPLAAEGHINCSPRSADAFRVIDEHHVMWGDRTGSGAETISHLQENGRIVVMFCAFAGKPRIVRMHGRGEVIYPSDLRFAELRGRLAEVPGLRAIMHVSIDRVSSSCGFGVPTYLFSGRRDTLDDWARAKGEAGLSEYRHTKNTRSIDGLPAYRE
jgi:hypothetical protein